MWLLQTFHTSFHREYEIMKTGGHVRLSVRSPSTQLGAI